MSNTNPPCSFSDCLRHTSGKRGLCQFVEVDGKKRCTACKELLPVDHYHKGRAQCKDCRSAHMASYYRENAEEKRAYMRKHRRDNVESIRINEVTRYQRHREKRIALASIHSHIRRARLNEVPSDYGISQLSLRKIHGDFCAICGSEMTFGSFPRGEYIPTLASIEHIVPLSRGGSNTWDNVTLTCLRCNLSKNSRTIDEVKTDGS